jgi:hypothetical protein
MKPAAGMSQDDRSSLTQAHPMACEPWTDQLSKALARTTSRRTAHKVFAAGTVAGMLALEGCTAQSSARMTPTPVSRLACPACPPCTACTVDRATGDVTCAACGSGCPSSELCTQAIKDPKYQQLDTYLRSQGFRFATVVASQHSPGGPTADARAALLVSNGQIQGSVVSVVYSARQNPAQSAVLFHITSAALSSAVALVTTDGRSYAGLFVDNKGHVQRTVPQAIPTPAQHASRSSRSNHTLLQLALTAPNKTARRVVDCRHEQAIGH